MRHIAALLTLVILAAGSALAWWGWQSLVTTDSFIGELPTAEVTRGDIRETIVTMGELQAAKSAVLSSPFSGKITRIIPEGTRVEPGDAVVWFETDEIKEEYDDQLAQLELDKQNLKEAEDQYELEKIRNEYTLESQQTQVEIARRAFEDAQQRFQAEQTLFERNISPQTKLDEARLTLLQRELQLRNAQIELAKVQENLAANLRVRERAVERERLKVENTEREVNDRRERLDSAIVRADTRGDISYLKIWKSGESAKVAEGDQVWRRSNLVEIPDTSEMHISVPVNELDLSQVERGHPALIELIALPDVTFEGEVLNKSIVPITDQNRRSYDSGGQNSGPREFEVRLLLKGQNELFRQGMTARAHIIVDEEQDAILVPLEAIFERQGERGVYVRGDGGGARFVAVETTLTGENHAAVTADGINEGDRVFLAVPDDEAIPAMVAEAAADEDSEGSEAQEADAPDAPVTSGGAS